MNNKVYFKNNGTFDVRAMLTFGVSAKGKDDAIGYFGTGFKYAVSIILRNGGSIKVTSGGEEFVFSRKTEQIRGESFDIVYVNDREAGFTTRLGINWQPWMAFRELYCNTKDENGVIDLDYEEYDTVIEVDCREIFEAYSNRDSYFIDTPVIHKGSHVDIHEKAGEFIYYKGVAVAHAEDCQYGYNIKSYLTLTEDRTVRYEWSAYNELRNEWQALKDSKIIRKLVSNIKSFEAKIGFDADRHTSDEFVSVCAQMMKTDAGVNESARKLVNRIAEKKGDWPEILLTKTQLQMLEKAKAFLLSINIAIDDFPIKAVSGLGSGVMGRALDGVIYLSEIPFNQGTKQVASTLIEEWVHNKHGCEDFDRAMQSWLFDKILSIGEELNGEPL